MAWTVPATFINAQLVTHTHLNVIQDNINYLKSGRQFATAPITGTPTTTSTSFVVLTGATITFTTTGGRVAIFFVGAGENNGLNANVYSIYIDTLNQGDATFGMTTITNQQSNALNNATCFFLTDTAPSAASHTFDVRWRVLAGTGTVRVGRIWAWEIG